MSRRRSSFSFSSTFSRSFTPLLTLALATAAATPLVAACGDDEGGLTSDAAIAVPDAGDPGADAAPPAPACTCIALGADYTAGVGSVATLSLPELTVTQNVVPAAASGDPVLRWFGGDDLFVVNRFGFDNVTIIDRTTFAVKDQFSTGAASNPQDVAVAGGKAYVAALELGDLLVYDLADTSAPPAKIDLSAYDPDGVPNASSIFVAGDRAFVALSRLDDSYIPVGVGQIVVVDLTNDTVDTVLDLHWQNPTGFLRAAGADLVIASADDYSGTRGCLEHVATDPAAVVDCVAENDAIGGTINAIAVAGEITYVVVTGFDMDFNPYGRVVAIAADGSFDAAGLTPATQTVSDAAWCQATNQLVYTDSSVGGLRVLDLASGEEVTTAPLDLGQPPAFSNGIVCY